MRRAKKALRDELIELLEVKVKEKNTGKKVTTQKAISAALVRQAMTGNTKAFEIIRDTVGQKVPDRVMIAEVDPAVIEEVEHTVLDDN